jgi:predicted dehydrogenase
MPRCPRPIVVIGAGGIVKDAHLPAYSKAGFPVVGIYDLNVERARVLAKHFGSAEVFSSLEAAVNRAPEGAAFDMAIPASAMLDVLPHLPDGCGVMIQKPMGESLEEARRIRSLCHRKKLTAAVNFQLRFAPLVLAARSLIEQSCIGELLDMEVRVTVFTPWHLWTFLESVPRVEILYHSIHYLDLIRSFLGEPRRVYAKTIRHPKCLRLASTRSNIILDYGDNIRAAISTNHIHEFGPRHQESFVKWEGTRGAIKAQLGVNLNYPEGEPDWLEYCLLEEGREPRWESVALDGTWFPDAFIGIMASLMCFLEGSSDRLPTAVDDAFRTMALVEAAHLSSDSGGATIPLD